MKILLGAVAVALAIWSGIWFVGASATERVIGAWLSDRSAEGWVVTHDSVETTGYPARFVTVLTGIALADPDTGLAWEAPEFRIEQPAYQPNSIHAVWPAVHSVATPFERLTIRSGRMEAALEVQPDTALALEHSLTEMATVEIESSAGWHTTLDSATLEVTREDAGQNRYAILFDAAALTPSDSMRSRLDPAGVLPEQIEAMRLEAEMGFDRPWDIRALEVSRPAITRLDLAELRAQWGDLLLRASGAVDVDAEGYPTGEMSVRAENWRDMIEVGVNAGAIAAELRGTLETTLGFLSSLSGHPENIDATLGFRNQRVYFGPIPIGDAPRLVLR